METTVDYYELLGVEAGASAAEIKAAFKKLALRYHPDVYQGDDAQERMKQLLQAYQTLKNPQSRQEYDARLKPSRASASPTGSPSRSRVYQQPEAQEDGRVIAFPELLPGRGMIIDMRDIIYHLTAQEANKLVESGMLRGVRSEARPGDYYCHRCSYHWSVGVVRQRSQQPSIPRFCPNCRAADWPEYLLLHCDHCNAVFESEQLRYEVGTVTYGRARHGGEAALCYPYELFPICPHCRRSHWCPAEEERMELLLQKQAQQALLWKVVLVSLVVVCLLFLLSFLLTRH